MADGTHQGPRIFSTAAEMQAQRHVRVLLDSAEHSDAILMGFDAASEGDFRMAFDGGGTVPSVLTSGPEGEVEATGLSMIRQIAAAWQEALTMAERHQAKRVSGEAAPLPAGKLTEAEDSQLQPPSALGAR